MRFDAACVLFALAMLYLSRFGSYKGKKIYFLTGMALSKMSSP